MKAITLWPEWAHAVAHLGKRIENRPWRAPEAVIGQRIAIHAGANIGGRPGWRAAEAGMYAVGIRAFDSGISDLCWCGDWCTKESIRVKISHMKLWRQVICGAVVCTARLIGCSDAEGRGEWPAEAMRPSDWAWGDPESPWWWHLDDVRLVRPVPAKGRLGLWEIDDSLIEEVKP